MSRWGVGRRLQGRVEKIVSGGEGLLRIDGKVVFVAGVCEEEDIEIEIVQEKNDWARAALVRIVAPSSKRIAPRCRHFGRCGGCQLQHMPYEEQLRLKDDWARQALGRLQENPIEWLPIVGAEETWAYRSRVQIHAGHDGRWGFQAPRSHDVVALEECPVADPDVVARVLALPRGRFGERREITGSQEKSFEERSIQGYSLRTPQGGFMQIHEKQNARLVDAVLNLAGAKAGRLDGACVWDLFSGSGNFSLPLARYAQEVWAVEGSHASSRACAENAKRNGLANVHALSGGVGETLKQLPAAPAVVVLDPPREGAKEILDQLPASAKILYVSCDLPRLTRDLRLLLGRGFHLESAQVIDLFPQTHHVETLVLLRAATH